MEQRVYLSSITVVPIYAALPDVRVADLELVLDDAVDAGYAVEGWACIDDTQTGRERKLVFVTASAAAHAYLEGLGWTSL